MPVSLERAKKFYKKGGRKTADDVVRSRLEGNQGLIVYGGRAINEFLDSWLDEHTEDWDIFSKTPRVSARMIERALDDHFGGDLYKVKKGKHAGTFRVISKVTGKVEADVTLQTEEVPSQVKRRVNYATHDYHEDRIRDILKDPDSAYRHDKDRATLQRIQIQGGK